MALTKLLIKFYSIIIIIFSQISEVSAEIDITPLLGYRIGGDFESSTTSTSYELEESETLGVVLDIDYNKFQQITILYSRQESNLITSETGVSNPLFPVDVVYLHIGGNQIWIKDNLRPYFGATIGVTHFRPEARSSTTKFSLSIGGGSKFFFTKNIALLLGARAYVTFISNSSSIFCGNEGCLVTVSGSALYQFEVNAGVTFRF